MFFYSSLTRLPYYCRKEGVIYYGSTTETNPNSDKNNNPNPSSHSISRNPGAEFSVSRIHIRIGISSCSRIGSHSQPWPG